MFMILYPASFTPLWRPHISNFLLACGIVCLHRWLCSQLMTSQVGSVWFVVQQIRVAWVDYYDVLCVHSTKHTHHKAYLFRCTYSLSPERDCKICFFSSRWHCLICLSCRENDSNRSESRIKICHGRERNIQLLLQRRAESNSDPWI